MAFRALIGSVWPTRRQAGWEASVEGLRASAAYLAQGSSYSYLRARTLLAGPRLFQDVDFGFALSICKWEGFAVAAQDLILILEADLRNELPADAAARGKVLLALYCDVLAAEQLPEHRATAGWDDMIDRFSTRLTVFTSRPPLKPDAISIETALTILAHAPIEDSVREADRMMVVNNVAFRFIEVQAKLRRQLDLAQLAADLSARAASADAA